MDQHYLSPTPVRAKSGKWRITDEMVAKYRWMLDATVPDGAVAIPIDRGLITYVSQQDAYLLDRYPYHLRANTSAIYLVRTDRSICPDGRKRPLHRDILGDIDGMITDHIDGNSLNNVRSNLRHCTHAQNAWNNERISRIFKRGSRYTFRMMNNGIRLTGNSYATYDEAAAARRAAYDMHREQYVRMGSNR